MKIEGLKIELAPIMIGTSSALFTDETTPWIHADLTQAEQYIFHICKKAGNTNLFVLRLFFMIAIVKSF